MKRIFKKRLTSFALALTVMLTVLGGSIPTMAAETDHMLISNNDEITQEDVEIQQLRSKIDTMIAETDSTTESYKTDYWGPVTFTNSHTGAWHTIYGHQARMAIAFKPIDGNTCLTCSFSTGFWSWYLPYAYNAVDADGYYMYVGPWCDITYQGVYRMLYEAWTTGDGSPDDRTVSCHVWVDYK